MLHPRQKLTDLKLCQLTAHLFNQSSIFGNRPPAGAARDNQTGTLQLGEGFLHGVRIDGGFRGQFPNRGELLAGLVDAGDNFGFYDILQLQIDGTGIIKAP